MQVITIIVLLVLIGGSFTVLDKGGILKVALSMIVARFKRNKFLLMAAIILFFMLASSVLGIYEEAAPLVVFIVPLALYLGWDSLTGLGMSLLALGFGFAAATMDPFMVTIAQSLAGLPLYSGLWLRAIFFVTMFALVFIFVRRHARKVERDPAGSLVYQEDLRLRSSIDVTERWRARKTPPSPACAPASGGSASGSSPRSSSFSPRRASRRSPPTHSRSWASSSSSPATAPRSSRGRREKPLATCFLKGMGSIVPAIVMILMAMSVKLIITKGGILDTILFVAAGRIGGVGPYAAVAFVYLITLVFEFFIPSASAKAFLIIPILAPLADLVGLTRQTVVFAFDNGDGFANILYPTNPFLMICLGLTVVSYPKWFRWTLPLQAITVLVCLIFMFFAVAIRFGPF